MNIEALTVAELASEESRQTATPMMEQYIEIKAANPDSLLFYRMGDFYELFFEDALEASRALGITLTKRGQHMGLDIPMCGVPVHAADDYLQKLIKAGSTIGMDRFGIDSMLPTDKRVATIVKLCEKGHAANIVLSHDTSCYIDWFPEDLVKQAMPRWHFLHVSDDVVPALRASGVPDDQIDLMTTGNPRRIFERQGAY